jgi:hypothetical protein
MNANLTFATHRTRFVLVNDRLPRMDGHCALCGSLFEKGYVRDSRTRLIYCDTQCFPGGADIDVHHRESCEERLVKCSNRNCVRGIGPSRPSARVVQHATLPFKELPRCIRG